MKPADKELTVVSYSAGETIQAFVEPLSVGLPLPDMPLFIETDAHMPIPLESTFRTTFSLMPKRWSEVLESVLS